MEGIRNEAVWQQINSIYLFEECLSEFEIMEDEEHSNLNLLKEGFGPWMHWEEC